MTFASVYRCWVCGSTLLERFHQCRLDFERYETQDPELHAYTGEMVWICRCTVCGFAQPECLPTLPRFFERMYDQHWSEDWIEHEFDAEYKDFIFEHLLAELERRVPKRPRRLLDIGTHVGRFMLVAQQEGWDVEGVEVNPRTAQCASRRTQAPVYQSDPQALVRQGRRYGAVTLIDVLEHIPEPARLLATVRRLVQPGGCVAIKVPCGRSQWHKELVLAAIDPSHRVSLAENLVHVNHFSPRSLTLALQRAGFERVQLSTAPPELLPLERSAIRRTVSNAVRLGIYVMGRLPGAIHTPFALNLQAFARVPA